jgi:hypothetical protein
MAKNDDADTETGLDAVDIALAAMQGLLASGMYNENPQAAGVMAWHLVAPFIDGMTQYSRMVEVMASQQTEQP